METNVFRMRKMFKQEAALHVASNWKANKAFVQHHAIMISVKERRISTFLLNLSILLKT